MRSSPSLAAAAWEWSTWRATAGVSVGLAFLGDYLDAPRRDYEITYHFLSHSGSFLPLANRSEGQNRILHPVQGAAPIEELRSRARVTEGDPAAVAVADIQAFNDGIGARGV